MGTLRTCSAAPEWGQRIDTGFGGEGPPWR
jgi:hypothetical protein